MALLVGGGFTIEFSFDECALWKLAEFSIEQESEVKSVSLGWVGSEDETFTGVFGAGAVFLDADKLFCTHASGQDIDNFYIGDDSFTAGRATGDE